VSTQSPFCESLLLDPGYGRLKDHVIKSTGLAYYSNKDSDLAARIGRRLAKACLHDCNSYLDVLTSSETGEAELDELIAELTIGETYFFRYREQFQALQNTVLPDIIARNQSSRRLRIWSAGCATGAEAYSIAILLKNELSGYLAGWDLSIIGTDINRAFLSRAREGTFEEWAFRSTPNEVLGKCFRQTGKSWAIVPEYKECLAFQYHNLVKHPFPSLVHNLCSFDLILCRNVMIYFNRDIMSSLIEQFHECLVEGGWLLVGHAEPNVELFRSFQAVSVPGATLYQKSRGSAYPLGAPGVEEVPTSVRVEEILSNVNRAIFPRVNVPAKQAPRARANAAASAASELSDVRLLADQGQWEQAARCSRKLLETDAMNPKVHFYYSLVLEQMGLHAEAEQSLRRAVYLDRSFVLAHYYLALVLQKRGDHRGAARAFENVRTLARTMDAGEVLADADEMTAGDLMNLTETHLEVLQHS
jgi:chemotaxis protein methyltransferase CheR